MLTIKTIASSSSGNCYLINDDTTSLLIECGISIKKIKEALNFKLSAVSGCLVSHEHGDHSKAVKDIARAGLDCYTGQGTIDALGITHHRLHPIEAKKMFSIGSFKIMPFTTKHDAAEPLGFLIVSGKDKLLFATDTAYINHKFNGLTHIMIEANYTNTMLEKNIENGTVCQAQKDRLLFSHLSLANVLRFLGKNDLSKLKSIHLMHLSSNNSDEAHMKRAVAGLSGVPVYVAKEK